MGRLFDTLLADVEVTGLTTVQVGFLGLLALVADRVVFDSLFVKGQRVPHLAPKLVVVRALDADLELAELGGAPKNGPICLVAELAVKVLRLIHQLVAERAPHIGFVLARTTDIVNTLAADQVAFRVTVPTIVAVIAVSVSFEL